MRFDLCFHVPVHVGEISALGGCAGVLSVGSLGRGCSHHPHWLSVFLMAVELGRSGCGIGLAICSFDARRGFLLFIIVEQVAV